MHVRARATPHPPDGTSSPAVSRADFESRLRALQYAAPMGPKGAIKPDDAEPSVAAFDLLWDWLSSGSNAAAPTEELEAAVVLRRLQDMSSDEDRLGVIGEGPDSLDWKAFARALGVAPFERW